MKKALLFGLFISVFLSNVFATGSEFIIAPAPAKNASANTLKERIGEETKRSVDATIELASNFGSLQVALAVLQKKLTHASGHNKIKEALTVGAELSELLGLMHTELSLLQKKCSSVAAKLIDNDVPFKKAQKKQLKATFTTLSELASHLQACINNAKKSQQRLSNAGTFTHDKQLQCMRDEKKLLAKEHQTLKSLQNHFLHDALLKQV